MIRQGDCLEILKSMKASSVDSLVTDPPAGISFMGKDWDSNKGGSKEWIAWMESVMKEALRVLKPGAHGLVWAIPRTSHWTATALEQAGFEIRDVITHIFGSGFPKSLDISKAIDKAAGAEREVIGPSNRHSGTTKATNPISDLARYSDAGNFITAPATPEAKQWQGFGTALKPASEHWILCRKPLSEKTVASNVLKWGVGGINIDASRIGTPTDNRRPQKSFCHSGEQTGLITGQVSGRFPANFVLSHNEDCEEVGSKQIGSGEKKKGSTPRSNIGFKLSPSSADRSNSIVNYGTETVPSFNCTPGCAVKMLDEQSGNRPSAGQYKVETLEKDMSIGGMFGIGSNKDANGRPTSYSGETGGASRFFYCAKASKADKNTGCEGLAKKSKPLMGEFKNNPGRTTPKSSPTPSQNYHPTVKSTKLMQYLIRLVTPPKGLVLDPFTGSGSTGVAALKAGFRFIGIEREIEYVKIAKARLEHASA